jgi:hypothetical protein
VGQYVWLILKNVVGWLLILASFVLGPLFPGPTGIPLFLIGFALIWFPGKRRFTARVLRGRPIRVNQGRWTVIAVALAVALPLPALLVLRAAGQHWELSAASLTIYCIASACLGALILIPLPGLMNLLLRIVSRARRMVRPWLRQHGIDLLPPRRRARYAHTSSTPFDGQADPIVAWRLHRRNSV